MTGGKLHNEYERLIGETLYAKTPKAVLAAVAVSFAAQLSESADDFLDDGSTVEAVILQEWDILHSQGIVPQAPPKGWDS